MPPKRPLESSATTSTIIKKQKIDSARQIDVEFPSGLPSNTIEGLPATIDVERFAEARSFEIGAMQSAMKNTASTAIHRVWQTLPRHLRRRAASHDVRRVPVRLREKAKYEIDPTKRKSFLKLLKRKKRLGRDSKRSEKFANRQKSKIWLETHLWHAKRMHMQDKWGYRLALRPTEKSYRSSYRAAVHGSTLNDVSYMATVELTGHMEALISVLKRCCNPCGVGPWAARYASGARICSTHFFDDNSWPIGLIGPGTVFWRPPVDASDHEHAELNAAGSTASPEVRSRTLWIRAHPASLKSVLESLKSAREHIPPNSQLEIADLSGDINAFELVGPRTSQVIHGALRLADCGREVGKFWDNLAEARSPGNFPTGMIVGVTVHDPRLNFPPTNTKVKHSTGIISELVTPNSTLAQSELWEQEIRDKLRTPKFKKAALDRRRSKNLIPGTRLRPTKEDDRIPIILIQTPVSVNLDSSTRDVQSICGWTILLPPSWSMAFLNSLVHTGTRVVGIAAQHHQRLEVDCPYFPHDYVGTSAFHDHTEQQAALERAKWERTPKGKRVNYESLATGSPWIPDWASLISGTSNQADLIPTDHAVSISQCQKPWLLTSPDSTELMKYLANNTNNDSTTTFGEWINVQRVRRGMVPIEQNLFRPLYDSIFIHVRLDMPGRGNPQNWAILYGFATREMASQWKAEFDGLDKSDDKNKLAATRSDTPIIGYVTSGGFSLQAGRGHSIGAISLRYLLIMVNDSTGMNLQNHIVRVRNVNSELALPGLVSII